MSTTSPVPVGDLPGWKQTYANDFDTNVAAGGFQFGSNGALLSTAAAYGPYYTSVAGYQDGTKDTSKVGEYRPSATLSVSNSALVCSQSVIAGVPVGAHFHPIENGVSPTTGAWARGPYRWLSQRSRAYGTTTRFGFVGLLIGRNNPTPSVPDPRYWPWAGEFDFPEGGVGSATTEGFHHTAVQGGGQIHIGPAAGVDRGQFHIYDTIWTPNRVQYLVDGVTVLDTSNAVSAQLMSIHFQGATTGTAPLSTDTGGWEIDWVAIYDSTATASHRIQRLRGAVSTATTTDVAYRVQRLRGTVSQPAAPVTAALTGPATVEPFEVFTLDASGSTNASRWLFTQVSGPAVTLTGTGATRTATAPPVGGTAVFRVTASNTGSVDKTADVSVVIYPPYEYIVAPDLSLLPVEQYLI